MSTQAFTNAVFATLSALMEAEFPAIPVMYENGPEVDEEGVGDVFLDAEVRWYGANLVTLERNPMGRHTGAISLQVYCKQAEGTEVTGALVDRLITEFKARRLGQGLTKMPQRSVPTHLNGWHKTGLFVPFQLDQR